MKLKLAAALLAGSAVLISAPAFAQDPAPQDQPDPSDAAADQAIANAQTVDDAQAKIELLQAQVEALQSAIEQVKTSMVKATPTWKGAPQWEDKEAGFSFKPKGLIQYDAGYTGYPRGKQLRGTILGIGQNGAQSLASGLNYQNLGWNSRARRLTIGADGTIPGGFRYSAEFNFAQGSVDYEDIWMAYDVKDTPVTLQAGYFYPFSSLETMTSSKFTSFMERTSFHDAWNISRRLGVAFIANDKKADSWVFQAGIFNDALNNTSNTRTAWQASARAVYSPTFGPARLHLGANFQHRANTREAEGMSYQPRPLTQLTDQRFISTGNIPARGDDIAGVELGAIWKSLHFAGEAQKVWVRHAFTPTEIAALNLSRDSNEFPTGAGLFGEPSFWSGYAELGYYITGETRGYKTGAWQRTKVLHPFNEGGWGALQINGRVDYVDLSDRVQSAPAGTSTALASAAPFFVNGGKQTALEASLIWNPTDYVRFMAQYGHLNVKGGPRASVTSTEPPIVFPVTSATLGMFPFGTTSAPLNRSFGVNTFAVRAQLDF